MPSFNRFIIIVLDSLGVGELPDAAEFGDQGANTLKHTDERKKGLKIPVLESLGLKALLNSRLGDFKTRAFFSRMKEVSRGKDTTTGHWEMMALPLTQALSHFPSGFPDDLMSAWTQKTGFKFLGNKPASGTVIIDELGAKHLQTGAPIVYTSADSVFQIAAHEEAFGLQQLYDLCELTRKFLDQSAFQVGRVIARPFLGVPGSFKRTSNRRDYSLKPPSKTVLSFLSERGISVTGIGKIPYIFGFEGITKSYEAHDDREAIESTLQAMREQKQKGVIFTNLNDLDMIYGHRRDFEGYGSQLEWIDSHLNHIISAMDQDDLLVITADHGNDPTFKGTDHTREYVPLLLYSPRFKENDSVARRLNDRESFSDIGQSLCENFGIPQAPAGKSFLKELA